MGVTYRALRTRYLDDIGAGGPGAVPALSRALEAIGWRAIREPTPEELAAHILHLLDACVIEHHDTEQLTVEVAAGLRDAGPLLDGGLPPVNAYLPAAAALLEHYLRDAGVGSFGFDWSGLMRTE